MQSEAQFARNYGSQCQGSVQSGWGAIACPSPAVYRYQLGGEWWQKCRKHTPAEYRKPENTVSRRDAALHKGMTTYRAKFTGSVKGAIGKLYPIVTTVEGQNEEAARLNLYDRYEHIGKLKLTPDTRPGSWKRGRKLKAPRLTR